MRDRALRPGGASQIDAVAAVVQRLAVLLEAGVSPQSAWGYLVPPDPAPTAEAAAVVASTDSVRGASVAGVADTGRPVGPAGATHGARATRAVNDTTAGRVAAATSAGRATTDVRAATATSAGGARTDRRAATATSAGRAQTDVRAATATSSGRATSTGWLTTATSAERVTSTGRVAIAATTTAGGRRHARLVATIARAVGRGAPADAAIAAASRACDRRTGAAWRAVAAAWQVADASGASIAPCLRDMAASLREIGDTQRIIDVALAAPIATTRLMTALPLVALGFGALLGFDTFHTVTATWPGAFCLAAGVGLLLVSRAWNRRLVRTATPKTVAPGLGVELMAVGMAGGVSLDGARHLTETALRDFGLDEPGSTESIDAIVELSRRAGVPAAELLRSEGRQLRRETQASSQKAAAALSIRLMLPLGLCVLPAFMLLGVAPLLLTVISSTFGSW